ncbi:ABC-type transport system permease protein (probable substrate dipeptide/oligopeptide) [Natrialba magadii ATCC 43099]|uniref:ABC-type transport system permease protein (Probable substrate dipeptide/oligopeptide) n=1 Tax=Natrialba magadii (strain ATCC 43099 / DSM 3394 / CCM 3739 / CIP 104546 / IAM 13178 / JCM 8861 / NBRC 102185 / NCIMB 2190 / MS3) TaxID=547559 RepID=D3SY78_NATMM|nr:ABC transporter permease [Natrialba magadii]ADD06049.1 ABC-type transport system permease protein (probable substrate dipeptide/oligopeptide) [Natrialba magadii ATCC 43099]ELY30954.1 binding-protein-dependent transporters inner membrane component [Natrialba magadii ATCC 43099]
MSMNEFDDKTLRERITENPQPALAWLAGALVLVVLELGRLASGLVQVGETTRFALGGIASVPGSVEESVASSLGEIAGLVAFGLTVLVLLGIAAILVKWLLIPWTLVDRLGIEASTGVKDVVERAIVTGLLVVATALVVLTPVGGVLEMAVSVLTRGVEWVGSLPTITSRELIPNEGYQQPDGSWEGTFLGLSPAVAWALRVAVVYAYALVWLAWLWRGYETFREHYREADWTPRDDSIDRLRNHYWGMFGLVVVIIFLVMALWAPAVSPATADANLYQPYEHEFEYYGDDGLESITHGEANSDSRSQGGDNNVGLMSYDDYDRFHPFGTNTDGKDLFTFLAYGAQVSLVIGLLATVLMAVIATALALITAYYKGVADLVTIVASDSIISLPRFLLVLLLSVLFMQANHPVAEIYDGGLLLALIFAGTGWPLLWRSVRGPALQVSEQEWIDAAKSYGQSPAATMRKHMAPYIAGYMLIYASLSLGGVIIGVAALSFLGFGVQAPTPEWGRAVYEGQSYIATSSWHIATLPGILVVLLVTGFNALGDGIRDAIDPQSDAGDTAGAAGGGG